MSVENTEKGKTESPTLLNYLREEIPIEDMRDYASPRRIGSIDFVKGFAIIMIILAHCSSVWFDSDWIYLYGMVFIALDILGPSLFVFLSALSVIFSVKRKQGKLPDNVIRNRIFSRGLMIIAIAIPYNLIAIGTTREGYSFPYNLWGWNILMFIGFSQIFSYYALKLGKTTRAVIGVGIIQYSESIREVIYLGKDSDIFLEFLHYLIISPAPQVTFFPWVAVCFISTIFGEFLYEAMDKGTEDAYLKLFYIFLIWGLILVGMGIFFPFPNPGWAIQVPGGPVSFPSMTLEEYEHLKLLEIMNQQKYYQFQGLPLFLIRGTTSSMYYNLGAALLIIALCFYLIDIRKIRNHFTCMIQYYGKVSLSLFLIHYLFLPFFIGAFNIVVFPFVMIAFAGILGFSMYYWMESGGVGTPEWIMIQVGRVGQKTGETVKKDVKKVLQKTSEGLQKFKKKA